MHVLTRLVDAALTVLRGRDYSLSFTFLSLPLFFTAVLHTSPGLAPRCRTQPGDPAFPSVSQLDQLNATLEGRLIKVVPTARFCNESPGGCSDAEFTDANFRNNIPGSMLRVNWEQDYASDPPSLCFRNSTVCGQGSVPIYGVNATTAAHIQAGVRFAQAHNLKVAIKASGHDFLGRSTAKNSFLLWTRCFQDITFHDSFRVGGKDLGSAVTVGSGVGLHNLYQATKAQRKIYVGGAAETVVAAGGYVQGAGHSALGPTYGLAADNVLEFQVVIADGYLVTANEISHPNLFWALRGGGAGSWGVIVSATLQTFPTFDVVHHRILIGANSSTDVGEIATLHAQHIFDWDHLRLGQYFYVTALSPSSFKWSIDSIIPRVSVETANAALAPFVEAVHNRGFQTSTSANLSNANDALSQIRDPGGDQGVMGSRLVPEDLYRQNASAVGETYRRIFDAGAPAILGHLVAGGRVSENSHIHSAVLPKWRSAKTHVIIIANWTDSTPLTQIEHIRSDLTTNKVPFLETLAGAGSGSYSNEGDLREPRFQDTFYGVNYQRLSAVKEVYDPLGLFVVAAGVGSERWDAEGLCRVG